MKKHIYIYEKVLTFVLAFAMIVGFWSGMTLDARAEDQVIDDVEITVEAPVPGQSFPGVKGVRVITPEDEIDVIKVVWWNYSNGYNEVAQDSTVEYNTKYMVRVWLQAKDNYKFAKDALDKIKINDSSEHISGNLESGQKVLAATHNFEETAPDPAKTINSVDITVDQPVAGQNLVNTCIVSTSGVKVSGVKWLYAGGVAYGQAGYNTEYRVQVELVPEAGYKFDPKIKATVNGHGETQLLEGDTSNIYVRYTFPATDPKPSDEEVKITEGNNSTYKPGSNESLTFRGTGDLADFQYVKVDGSKVDSANYDKSEGSTIITFKPEYLKTLSNGTHTVEMIWYITGAEKSATASFYIGEKGGEIVPGNTGTTQPANDSNDSELKPRHICSFEWVITVDPTTGGDGLEEYMCTGCGAVSQSHPIAASVAVIKDFYGNVKEAPENGSITYDSGKLYTISDYLLKKMAERNDVSVTVKFEYQNKKYQLTFPAGLNYSAVLTDEETMYGYFGAAAKLGLKVAEQ